MKAIAAGLLLIAAVLAIGLFEPYNNPCAAMTYVSPGNWQLTGRLNPDGSLVTCGWTIRSRLAS